MANHAKDLSSMQEFDAAGRGYWNCPGMDTQGSSNDADRHLHEERSPSTEVAANLISSLCKDGLHRPVLDFDFPARYVPSSTPGHGHLYIDRPLSWEDYQQLIKVMAGIGLLEPGYVNAANERKATFVRPEWVFKKPGVATPSPALPESPASPDYDLSKLLEDAGV